MDSGTRFVGKFVNEMYAILLGIGISNIIFVQKLNLKNLTNTVMALFITSVVLLYWWDWSEYIDEDIKSTKREFGIDFLILIALEMLFAYFSNPHELALIFFVLGILDLIWVINNLIERRKELNTKLKAQKWIMEKLLVIGIYGVTWGLISYLALPDLMNKGLIIASFALVRNIGFVHVRKAKKMSFWEAAPEDARAIVEINHSYIKSPDKDGFLLKKLSLYDVQKVIDEKENRYFVAKTASGAVAGFIEIASVIEPEILDQLSWQSISVKENFLPEKYFYIEQIAVKEEFKRKGVANFLYQSIFNRFPDKFFSAFVVKKPIENQTSSVFHLSQGFFEAALFKVPEFMGLSPYESILYLRKPETQKQST